MKTLLRFGILAVLIFVTSSCFPGKKMLDSNTVILPLSDTVRLREGSIVYALPRTVITVVVDVERTIEIPGPYARFANDLLGLTNIIREENESWDIVDLKVINSEETDPSEYYVINTNSLFQTNVLALKREGLILDLNPENFNAETDLTGKGVSDAGQFKSFDLGSDEYYQLQRDTAYKRVSIDSSFIRIPYIVEKKKMLTIDQLAEKAAKRLMELRDGKHLLLTGEATVFPQNDAAIIEMNRMEKDYTELFTGKVIKQLRTFTYQIIPRKEMAGKSVPLFSFSETTGPSDPNSKDGQPVMIEFVPENKTKDITIITKPAPEPEPETSAERYDKLFYRVPEVVKLKISYGKVQLLNSRRLVYQFGQTIQLPGNYIIGK
jgi:hypothetical protein